MNSADLLRHAIDCGLSPFPVCGVLAHSGGAGVAVCTCPWHNADGKACHSPGKVPLFKWGGLWRATTFDDCLAWIDEYEGRGIRSLNWAIHLGLSGCAVLDVDPRNGGESNWLALSARYNLNPAVPRDSVKGRGYHLWFTEPPPGSLPNETKIELSPGLELKYGKTYVVGPPSMHRCGQPYVWDVPPVKGASK